VEKVDVRYRQTRRCRFAGQGCITVVVSSGGCRQPLAIETYRSDRRDAGGTPSQRERRNGKYGRSVRVDVCDVLERKTLVLRLQYWSARKGPVLRF
jgi:hypothetical protein